MKNIFDLLKRHTLILLTFLTIPTFISLIRPGYFWMQDDLQAFRIQQMDKCFRNFQFPCRWVPDPGYQYGYPQFIFYPPSVYYLGEAFHLIGFQFIDSAKILFSLGFVLSAVTMFIFLRSFLGSWPAFVGAMLYTYAPYKAVDVYVRGALSEFWSFVFFPLIFWSVYRLIEGGRLKYVGWTAFSVGMLLITHNLMSMIFLPLVAVWGLFWLFAQKRWRYFPKLFFGGLLGLGSAAFFTLPVLFERQYVHVESMLGGYFDYRQHFIDLKQIFFSNHWGYGSSYLGPNDDLALTVGIAQWLSALSALVLTVLLVKRQRKFALMAFVLTALALGSLFLTHQKSSFIWEKLTFLSWLQFPWRILVNGIFLFSILGAVAVYLLGRTRWGIIAGGILVISAFVLSVTFFRPYEWYDVTDSEKFSGKLWEKQLTISIFDYLPIYATLPPIQKAPDLPEALEGVAVFESYTKGSDFQIGWVKVEKDALVRLPLFDFPGMRVKLDGQVVSHRHDDCRGEEFCLGLINFNIPAGEHIIEVRLGNTFVRAAGNVLSFLSIVVVATIFWRSRHDKDKKLLS